MKRASSIVLCVNLAVLGIAAASPVLTDANPTSFCDAYVDAFERIDLDRCAASDAGAPVLRGLFKRQKERCRSRLQQSLSAGRVRIDLAAARRCIAARFATREQRKAPLVAACQDAVIGLQKLAQPCAGSIECKSGLFCDADSHRCESPRAARGPCNNLGEMSGEGDLDDFHLGGHPECTSGTHCGLKAACIRNAAVGDVCTLDECGPGLRCQKARCIEDRAGGLGTACEADVHCERDLYCRGLLDGEEAKGAPACAPKRSAGEPCARSSACKGECVNGRCTSFCGSG